MSSIVFQDPIIFRYLFSTISRLYDNVHFNVYKNYLKIIGIDPHDFCYMNLHMLRNFFRKYEIQSKLSFGIDITKLRSILPKISDANQIEIVFDAETVNFIISKDWKMIFKIEYLNGSLDLPQPIQISYNASVIMKATDFSKLIDGASTISDEIIFSIQNDQFSIMSEKKGHYFTGYPSQILEINNNAEHIQSQVITKYLSYISPLIKRCDRVKINLGENNPIKFDIFYRDKATFSFFLSQKTPEIINLNINTRKRSLPKLSSTKLPEYLLILEKSSNGLSLKSLIASNLETSNYDYYNVINSLGFVSMNNNKIYLTEEGKIFMDNFKADIKFAKNYINEILLSKNTLYNLINKKLQNYPYTPDELLIEVNKELSNHENIIDKNYMNVLLGIGMWCKKIDNKLALYYFHK